MTNLQKYNDFCKNWTWKAPEYEASGAIEASSGQDEQSAFFEALAALFGVSDGTAMNLWYAPQRSWFRDDMFDALIALDNDKSAFQPPLFSGEFEWDAVNKKFLPATYE